jgi:small lipoprotein (TIGR04452 family)
MIYRFLFLILLIVFGSTQCVLLEIGGLEYPGAVQGSKAKDQISEATLEAVTTGQLFWLAQNGMQAGVGLIAPLAVVNGFIASFIQPIISEIPDNKYYTETSVDECTKNIRGKGALAYGAFLDSLPPGGLVGGAVRDSILLPELADCKLEEAGKILQLEPVISL